MAFVGKAVGRRTIVGAGALVPLGFASICSPTSGVANLLAKEERAQPVQEDSDDTAVAVLGRDEPLSAGDCACGGGGCTVSGRV